MQVVIFSRGYGGISWTVVVSGDRCVDSFQQSPHFPGASERDEFDTPFIGQNLNLLPWIQIEIFSHLLRDNHLEFR